MSDKLQEAIKAIKAGNKAAGKRLLIEVLKVDRRNEAAWLWMTNVVDDKDERKKCLQNVLKINPQNEAAKRGLALLQQEHKVLQTKQADNSKSAIQKSPKKKNYFLPVILATILTLACITLVIVRLNNELHQISPTNSYSSSQNNVKTVTPVLSPIATQDKQFLITANSLGSKIALENEIVNKGWEYRETETMPDGTRCDTYEVNHVVFGLCAEKDDLKVIIVKGDAFANFDPVFAIADMYDIHYFGDFKDAVTDVWFDLSPGESTQFTVDSNEVIMTIQRTYDDGYAITYISESHLP